MEVKMIPIDRIRPAQFQPRELFDKEKIAELTESIKEMDLIAPIVVRKEGSTYQIIAGERRWRAWEGTGRKEIPAIIRESNTFEAMELSLIENWQREDLTEPEKEKFIYLLWKDGNKLGRYKSIPEMSRKIGISTTTLGRIIDAGDEKYAKTATIVVKKATAGDLADTRSLQEVAPEVRQDLLKVRMETPERLTRDEMREVVKAVKDAPEETRKSVVKLIANEKLEPKKVETFVKALKESPPDLKEKLIKQEITPEEAQEVRIFKTPEQRKQVLKERSMLRKDTEKDLRRFKTERVKQAEALERGKPVVDHLTRLAPGEVDHGEILLNKYQDAYFKVMTFRADHIKQIDDIKVRKACIDYVKKTYDTCVKVLTDLGEITVVK
jgi:ParB/RepB/Spo0J family partition protein